MDDHPSIKALEETRRLLPLLHLNLSTHTHTHVYLYIHIYVCVCARDSSHLRSSLLVQLHRHQR